MGPLLRSMAVSVLMFNRTQDRRADYGELVALGLAADNAWCGGVVLGQQIEGWHSLEVDNLPATTAGQSCYSVPVKQTGFVGVATDLAV